MLKIINLLSFIYLVALMASFFIYARADTIIVNFCMLLTVVGIIVAFYFILILTSILWLVLICIHFLPIISGLIISPGKIFKLSNNKEILYWSVGVIWDGIIDNPYCRIKIALGIGSYRACFCIYRNYHNNLAEEIGLDRVLVTVLDTIEEEICTALSIDDQEAVYLSYSKKEKLFSKFLPFGYYARCPKCARSIIYYEREITARLEGLLASNKPFTEFNNQELSLLLRVVRSIDGDSHTDRIYRIAGKVNQDIPWELVCSKY